MFFLCVPADADVGDEGRRKDEEICNGDFSFWEQLEIGRDECQGVWEGQDKNM